MPVPYQCSIQSHHKRLGLYPFQKKTSPASSLTSHLDYLALAAPFDKQVRNRHSNQNIQVALHIQSQAHLYKHTSSHSCSLLSALETHGSNVDIYTFFILRMEHPWVSRFSSYAYAWVHCRVCVRQELSCNHVFEELIHFAELNVDRAIQNGLKPFQAISIQ